MHIYLFVYNIIEEEGARNLKGGKRVMGELEKERGLREMMELYFNLKRNI